MRSASTRARRAADGPLDLDKHCGMAAQKATDIRRNPADVERNARDLRNRKRAPRKPASDGSGGLLAAGRRQGALCLEFVRRGVGFGRHPSSRSGHGRICGLRAALQRERNKLSPAERPEISLRSIKDRTPT
jgi:hypothetical protein